MAVSLQKRQSKKHSKQRSDNLGARATNNNFLQISRLPESSVGVGRSPLDIQKYPRVCHPWIYNGVHGYPGISMDVKQSRKYQLIFIETCGYLSTSGGIYRKSLISMVQGYRFLSGISMCINGCHGYQYKLALVQEYPWISIEQTRTPPRRLHEKHSLHMRPSECNPWRAVNSLGVHVLSVDKLQRALF